MDEGAPLTSKARLGVVRYLSCYLLFFRTCPSFISRPAPPPLPISRDDQRARLPFGTVLVVEFLDPPQELGVKRVHVLL